MQLAENYTIRNYVLSYAMTKFALKNSKNPKKRTQTQTTHLHNSIQSPACHPGESYLLQKDYLVLTVKKEISGIFWQFRLNSLLF